MESRLHNKENNSNGPPLYIGSIVTTRAIRPRVSCVGLQEISSRLLFLISYLRHKFTKVLTKLYSCNIFSIHIHEIYREESIRNTWSAIYLLYTALYLMIHVIFTNMYANNRVFSFRSARSQMDTRLWIT